MKISLPDIVGGGYGEFWRCKKRYRVVKGSRASKKSKTMALWIIANIIKYREANALVVRKTYRTLKDSCFSDLKWAANRLGVSSWFKFTESPLEAVYTPTGQKILFRGLDDPLKITSIAVETGVLCWLWIEEAYEVTNEDSFNILDESIRGEVPEGLFKQVTLTFNPWNERHWLKRRFFDTPSDDVYTNTTNYTCNEWLDTSDLKLFETMRLNNPRRYKVAGMGDWGISEGVIYDNWEEKYFDVDEVRGGCVESAFGLDFGYTNDPTALFCGLIDRTNGIIYVFDEIYEKGLTNKAITEVVTARGYGKEKIICDSAEPKSIDELRLCGLRRVKAARKGKDSVNNGIQYIQGFKLVVHPRCASFLTEINNYRWDTDKAGERLNVPVDDFNHLMDAMRYALEGFMKGKTFSFD